MDVPKFASIRKRFEARVLGALANLRRREKSKRAIICPPAPSGSVGDEAMIQATTTELIKRGLTVDILVLDIDEDWSGIDGLRSKVPLSRLEKRLGFITGILHNYDEFYLIGADVMDGYYDTFTTQWLLWLLWLASLTCKKATLIGSSYNDAPTPGSVAMHKILPHKVHIYCRDYVSQQRFKQHMQRNADLTADVAFLLDESIGAKAVQPYISWIKARKRKNGKVIGFNLSGHSFERVIESAAGREEVIELYKIEIETILKKEKTASIILLPHDVRGKNGDLLMLRDLYKRLSPKYLQTRVTIMDKEPLRAAGIKAVVKYVNIVISGRMHLAIACLGVSTPVACVTYQGKFEGLYEHFPGLKNLTLSADEAMQPGALSRLTLQLLKNELLLRPIIARRLPIIFELAHKNLS